MKLGIIPARAGSKGVPGKNVRLLGGHPLIAWTIAAARLSGVLDRIVVSTDGPEIAEVSHRYGAEVMERPAELATDDAPAKGAIRHAVDSLASAGHYASIIVYLQPTSPLHTSDDIIATINLVQERGFDSAASFTVATPHPDRAFLVNEAHEANPVLGHDQVWQMRQARRPQYHLNGAVYVMDARRSLADPEPRILHGRLGAHVMPAERSIDIDTVLDFEICEILIRDAQRPSPINGL